MKLYYFLLCITCVSCFHANDNSSIKEKIVGGQLADIKDVFYHASLYYFDHLFCGAAIIAVNWLLSAEICFIDKVNAVENVKAKTGTVYRDEDEFNPFIEIQEIKKYSDDFPTSDIHTNLVLLLLATVIQFNELQHSIPIANSNSDPVPNSPMKISGFGKTHRSNAYTSSYLRKTTVNVLERKTCPYASNYVFCAESAHSDACDFDEGGPGVIDNQLVAIITRKPKCKLGQGPGAYTKVGAFYHWITRSTGLRNSFQAY